MAIPVRDDALMVLGRGHGRGSDDLTRENLDVPLVKELGLGLSGCDERRRAVAGMDVASIRWERVETGEGGGSGARRRHWDRGLKDVPVPMVGRLVVVHGRFIERIKL